MKEKVLKIMLNIGEINVSNVRREFVEEERQKGFFTEKTKKKCVIKCFFDRTNVFLFLQNICFDNEQEPYY